MKRPLQRMAAALGALLVAFASPACTVREEVFGPGAPPVVASQPMAQPIAVQEMGLGGPAMWEVSDEDTTIYLFGTVHALPRDARWMTDRIEQALAGSGELVTEIALDQAKCVTPDTLKHAYLPEGENLRKLLGQADLRAYERAMASIGLPVQAFDRFEPWYAAMAMSLLPMVKQGYSVDSGVEAVLGAKSGPERKRGALETVEYQLGLFDSLPQDTQLVYLRQVSDSVPDMGTTLQQMVAEWMKGDADALARMMNDSTADPLLRDRLLLQRNRNWAKWIEARLEQPGTVFLAVGAGHLAGQGSVQDTLAKDGIVSRRVQ